MSSKTKKWLLIGGIFVVLFFSMHTIINSIVNAKVQSVIEKLNAKGRVSLNVDNIKLDVLGSKLVMQGVNFKPGATFFEDFKQGKSYKSTVGTFNLSELTIKGFSIFRILFSKEISTHKIIIDGLDLTLYKTETFIKNEEVSKKKIALDSLFIKGVREISLGSIEIDEFKLKILNIQTGDTLFQYKESELVIGGIDFEPYQNVENYFRFKKDDLTIAFQNQHFELKDGNYDILLNKVNYNFKDKAIHIENFELKPKRKITAIAASYEYNNEVFNVAVKTIDFYGIYIDSIVRNGSFEIDSLLIDGLNLEIYKDQTKPFNLAKRPLFLNQKLKELKQPLNIEKLLLTNGLLLYQERHEGKQDLMEITISDMNASIEKITSIKDSLAAEKELTIELNGKINKIAPLHLAIYMPYNTYNNSFSFSGEVGSANFSDFNSAIYPALGAKIEGGKLHSVRFNAFGNPQGTKGSMTMIYNDVNASFLKSKENHKGEKNKAVSWLTNTVIVSENPSSKGKLKVALIEAERVPYKGFGNLIWKSFMSGMMNTMLPTGKQIKESQIVKEQRKEDNKEARKEARRLKKEQKN
jgi:hypothetical protein